MTRIFDNIELNLGGHLVETLSESNRIDAAVGYFNIRGWKLFGDVVHGRSAGGPPIARVLIGMVHGEPEEQVLDHLQRTLEGGPLEDVIDRKTAQARQQQAKLKFRQQLMRGAPTAQDEATSIVYGMPAEALKLGGVDDVVPLGRVAEWIHSASHRPLRMPGATPG